ncbi:MAG: hypothetical protein Q8P21_00045 [bacterium]|nr:hypothetical protein [bacterium]
MLDRAALYSDRSLWIRQGYMEIVRNQILTAVIRIGDRSDPDHKNHIPIGRPLPIRFIDKPWVSTPVGLSDRRGDLLPDEGLTFERTECIVKRIQDLTVDDLRGTAPDTATPKLVRYHLASINNSPLPSWDTVVTIWKFKYLPNITE